MVLVGTGSEVSIAIEAAKALGPGARVVSMPCTSVFLSQDEQYRNSVLPPGIARVSVEAASTFGWHSLVHAAVGIDRFGASAPAADVYRDCGMTTDRVVAVARAVLQRYAPGSAPHLGLFV